MMFSSSSSGFNQKNIKQKLLVITVVTIVFTLIPIVTSILIYELISKKNAVMQEIRVQSSIVSDNVASALAFNDKEAAQDGLATLGAAKDIEFAILLSPRGELFSRYAKGKIDAFYTDNLDLNVYVETLTWTRFRVSQPIYLKSDFVGVLVVEANLDALYDSIKWLALTVFLSSLLAFFLSLSIGSRLNISITHPIFELLSSVKRVSDSYDFSIRPNISRSDEIGELAKAFDALLSDLEERDEKLHRLAFYDTLTKLPNRHYFQREITHAVEKTISAESTLALMFIDLDDFKIINDTWGHQSGDELLKTVARRIKASLRVSDMVFRLGGDEFAVILENISSVDVAERIAQNIIDAVSQPIALRLCDEEVSVGASVGISLCSDHATSDDDLLVAADSAMYSAKENLKNIYKIYTPKDSLRD